MKQHCSIITYWIFAGIIINIRKNLAQESIANELAFLCNEQDPIYCIILDNYHSQNAEDFNMRLNQYKNYIGFKPTPFMIKDSFQSPLRTDSRNLDNLSSNKMPLKITMPLNYDSKRRFGAWGGKRVSDPDDSQNNKREPAFSHWGGKRSQKFFNWGGKRNPPNNELNDATINEHTDTVMTRNTLDNDIVPLNENRLKRESDRKLCLNDEVSLQELLKEFIEWSRKQPEQKKNSFYRKMFGTTSLHGYENLSRRAGAFYPWGGKRNPA